MEKFVMKQVVQLGIVCDNAKEAMEKFCQMFQVPEDYCILLHVKQGENNAQFTADFAWVNYGGIQFEFIQPIGGDLETYSDYLQATGGGIHHIAFTAENSAQILQSFRDTGAIEVTPGSCGGTIPDPTVGYFDFHQKMGLRFEVSTKNLDTMTKMSFEKLK